MLKSKHVFGLAVKFICISMILLIAVSASTASETKNQDAIDAALVQLDLVDNGKYEESWDRASEYFISSVPKEDWERMISAARNPLGKVISRKLKSHQYTTSLPGAPDGEYVVIQFDTSFESKKSAIETITPMKDSDGEWRVSGYYIK